MSAPSWSRLWRWTMDTFATSPELNQPGDTPQALPQPLDKRGTELAGLLNLNPAQISRQSLSQSSQGSIGLDRPLYRVAIHSEAPSDAIELVLDFSADFVQAELVYLAGVRLDFDTLFNLLSHHNIEMLLPDVLSLAIEHRTHTVPTNPMEQDPTAFEPLAIALGQPALHGCDERLEFAFDYTSASRHFVALATASATSIPATVMAVWAEAGAPLAHRVEAETGYPGIDVFGRPLLVSQGKSTQIQAGSGVTFCPDSQSFKATQSGYVYLKDNHLGVRAPISIDEDRLAAHFLCLPLMGDLCPTSASIDALVEAQGLKAGIIPEQIATVKSTLLTGLKQSANICIAQGQAAVDGRDAELIFAVDCRPKPGRLLPDGRFDFRETHFGLNVTADQELATLVPATEGQDGHTIDGEKIQAQPGHKAQLEAGAHITCREIDGKVVFHAALTGRVRLEDNRLQVFETLHIAGDVDYSCGNIDFPGDVYIEGSVQSDFSVQAHGSIAVRGQIENGAFIKAAADLIVGGGITGNDTRITCGGKTQTCYIHSATLHCQGPLEVGSYIIKADIRCGATIVVHTRGGSRSGLVVGGRTVAADGLEARFVGSANGTFTELSLGVDPAIADKLLQCRKQQENCKRQRERYRHLLGLQQIDAASLKQLIRQATPKRRRQLCGCIREWQRLGQTLKSLGEKRRHLSTALLAPATSARLRVAGTLFPNVHLRLGEHIGRTHEPLNQTELHSENWTLNS
jgi:uncharacterized protein